MRLGVFCSSLGLVRGGLETVAHELASGVARLGHDVTVVVGRAFWGANFLADLPAPYRLHTVQCFPTNHFPVRIMSGQAPGVALRLQSRSFLHACRRDIDCVDTIARSDVTVSFFELETVELSRWREELKKPHVSYFPGGIRWSDLERDVSHLRLATSEAIARKYAGDLRIDGVVPPGVGPEWLTGPRQVRTVASSLLFVGRLEENKGVRTLLAVMKMIAAVRTDISLTLVGGGPLLRWVRREVVLAGLTRVVRVLGEIPHHSVRDEMKRADVFVFPTRYESFGISVLEAMAAGLPVVCSNLEVLRETTGDASVHVLDWEPETWKQAILDLVGDPERRTRLAQRGYTRAEQMTWSHFSRTMERYMKEVIRDAAS